jgi:hypothetical protein
MLSPIGRFVMRTVFISLFLCIASMAWSEQAPKIETEKQAEKTPRHQAEEAQKPERFSETLRLRMKESISSEEDSDGGEKGSEFWPTILGVKIKITDSLLVLFTLALAAFTYELSDSTQKLWVAAQTSADFAERGLFEVETARIHLNLPSTQTVLRWGVHAGPDVDYNLTNHGRTPAEITDARTKMMVVVGNNWPERGAGEDFHRHDTTRNLSPGGSTEGFYESLRRELTAAEQSGLQIPDGPRLYFLGRIQYNDIFHRRHTRWFCYKRFPRGQGFMWAERGPKEYNEETIEPAPVA